MSPRHSKLRRVVSGLLVGLATVLVVTACGLAEEPSPDTLREALEQGIELADPTRSPEPTTPNEEPAPRTPGDMPGVPLMPTIEA